MDSLNIKESKYIKADYLNFYFEDNNQKCNYYKKIKSLIPEKIIDDDINSLINKLVICVLKKTLMYNKKEIENNLIDEVSFEVIKNKKEEKDNNIKKFNDVKKRIRDKLIYEFEKQINPLKLINKLYDVDREITAFDVKYDSYDGQAGNAFYFIKYNNIEHPVEFARRILVDCINGRKIQNKEELNNAEIFKYFVSNDDVFNTDYSMEDVIESIKSLKGIKIEENKKIIQYVESNKDYIDLSVASPGTQTNSIMEYVLYQKSNVPLLIDQPEDNVDNESRYQFLTTWIKERKFDRQIILVSHDANIVINGDAENVIIAKYNDSKFEYNYGALEYSNNLDLAALILDGGKNAIRRRMQKYGE